MKVAFPTNRGEKIAGHSSFCKAFIIVDTETNERTSVDNPLRESKHTTGTKHDKAYGRHLETGRLVSGLLAAAGAEIYYCREAGERFVQRLGRNGIAVVTTEERQIDAVLQALPARQPAPGEGQRRCGHKHAGGGDGYGAGKMHGRGCGGGRGARQHGRVHSDDASAPHRRGGGRSRRQNALV